MPSGIRFLIHDKTLEINGTEYILGELAADCMNLTPANFKSIVEQMQSVDEKARTYTISRNLSGWRVLNNEFEALFGSLMQWRIFRALKPEHFTLFAEAHAILDRPMQPDYGFEAEWAKYSAVIATYKTYLCDIGAFNQTMSNLFKGPVAKLDSLTPQSCIDALYKFRTDSTDKSIVLPVYGGEDSYSETDDLRVAYAPREVYGKPYSYDIYEVFEAGHLFSLLKADFTRSLTAGHIIRQCKHCGKYFVLQRLYHSIYCDRPSPENPRFTCREIGSAGDREVKESAPKTLSYKRAIDRIDHDVRRKNIFPDDGARIKQIVAALHSDAIKNAELSADDFEQLLSSDTLYAKYGIKRKSTRRGRPKKSTL